VLGGANTVGTAIALYLLTGVVSPRVALTLVYAVGLTIVVFVTPRYVFGTRASWRRRLLLALWYVGTYVVGLGVISLLHDVVSAPRIVVVLGTVAVTAPLGFIGGRVLVARRD